MHSSKPELLPVFTGLPLTQISLFEQGQDVISALALLMHADVLGFDTESKPTFRKGEESTGPHLIQLSTDTHAYLFQVGAHYFPEGLKSVLESHKILKVGIGLGNDRRDLLNKFGVTLANVTDLARAIRIPGHRGDVGAKSAVAHFFGMRLIKSKKVGTSNWSNKQLTEAQILYAANDAYVALKAHRASLTWK